MTTDFEKKKFWSHQENEMREGRKGLTYRHKISCNKTIHEGFQINQSVI